MGCASGRQLTRIETGQRRRSPFNYLHLSPDGKLLYVARGHSSSSSIKKDGKRLARWDFAGDVRLFDLATGEFRRTIGYPPPHGIYNLKISPDGATLLTFEGVSGDYDRPPQSRAVLRDAATGRQRLSLPEGVPVFSPDSKALVITTRNDKYETTALQFLDAATGRVRPTVLSCAGTRVSHRQGIFPKR